MREVVPYRSVDAALHVGPLLAPQPSGAVVRRHSELAGRHNRFIDAGAVDADRAPRDAPKPHRPNCVPEVVVGGRRPYARSARGSAHLDLSTFVTGNRLVLAIPEIE